MNRWMIQTYDGRLVFVVAASARDADRVATAKGYKVHKVSAAASWAGAPAIR